MSIKTNTPPYVWRALHSWVVDAILNQPDTDVRDAMVTRIGGLDFRSMFEAFDRHQHARRTRAPFETGMLKTTSHFVDGRLWYRVLVFGDDGQWHGLVHPPASAIGLDDTATYSAEEAWNAMQSMAYAEEPPVPDDVSSITDPPDEHNSTA